MTVKLRRAETAPIFKITRKKGGPGSGHHGHTGLPGVWGGSRPGAGGRKAKLLGKVKGRIEAAKKKKLEPQPEQEDIILDMGFGVEDNWEAIKPKGADVSLRTFVENAWGYDDPETGFKSEIKYVRGGFGEEIEVSGYIINSEGEEFGWWKRTIEEDGTIYHNSFTIYEKGTGFGRRFYQASEEAYLAVGMKKVYLGANGAVGGYAWARMGFDFGDKDSPFMQETLSEIEYKMRSWMVRADAGKSQFYIVDEAAVNAVQHPMLDNFSSLKPWEIAAFEYKGVRVGKQALLGSGWNAVKYLDEDDEGFLVGQLYYQEHEKERKKGGPGSGHHGHSGLSGVWGGSTPSTGGGKAKAPAKAKPKATVKKKPKPEEKKPEKKIEPGFSRSQSEKHQKFREIFRKARFTEEQIDYLEASGAFDSELSNFPDSIRFTPKHLKQVRDDLHYEVTSITKVASEYGGDPHKAVELLRLGERPDTRVQPPGEYTFSSGSWDDVLHAPQMGQYTDPDKMRADIESAFNEGMITEDRYWELMGEYNEFRNDVFVQSRGEDPRAHYILNDGLGGNQYGRPVIWREPPQRIRKVVKDQIVTEIDRETKLTDYDEVNRAIKQWAYSANDEDMRSLSMQEAASEEFGVPLSSWQEKQIRALRAEYNMKFKEEREWIQRTNPDWSDEEVDKKTADFIASQAPSMVSIFESETPDINMVGVAAATFSESRHMEREVLKSMYSNTQEYFQALGIPPNTKIKLFRGYDFEGKEPPPGTVVSYEGNAMESWTAGKPVADAFGNATISMWVPIENIIATARTGYGCLTEGEFIVIGSVPGNTGVVEKRGKSWRYD